MGYDDFFSALKNQLATELPFVAFKKPHKNNIEAYLQHDSTLNILTDYSKNGFVFAPFEDTKPTLFFETENCQLLSTSISENDDLSKIDILIKMSDLGKSEYLNLIARCIEEIKSTPIEKIVLSRRENIEVKRLACFEMFKRLVNNYASAFVYIWYHPKVGLWMGATPENLMTVKDHRFSTMALAGTKQDLIKMWSDKEFREQQIVTNYIFNNLTSIVKDLNASKVETIKAGNVFHLKTSITGKLVQPKKDLEQLIKKLHPTPAVCGTPKELALNFIHKNEGYDREFYTGYLGEINVVSKNARKQNNRNIENKSFFRDSLNTELYVNLRCMKIKEQNIFLYAGGGITSDSVPLLEWQETQNKLQTLKSVLKD